MLTRVYAVAVKEFWGLVRQPQLLLLLLVGPVLIMTIFGLSLDVENILRPRALVVIEPGSEGAQQTLESTLRLWQGVRPEEDEDVSAALQRIDRAQGALDEVREAQ